MAQNFRAHAVDEPAEEVGSGVEIKGCSKELKLVLDLFGQLARVDFFGTNFL